MASDTNVTRVPTPRMTEWRYRIADELAFTKHWQHSTGADYSAISPRIFIRMNSLRETLEVCSYCQSGEEVVDAEDRVFRERPHLQCLARGDETKTPGLPNNSGIKTLNAKNVNKARVMS